MTGEPDVLMCPHLNLMEPPPGRHLRICPDCLKRIIECAHCDAKLVAGPEVGDSGWRAFGSDGSTRLHACPACTRY